MTLRDKGILRLQPLCLWLNELYQRFIKSSHNPNHHSSFCHEFKHEFYAAVFVASLLTVLVYKLHWLDASKYEFFELALTQLPFTDFSKLDDEDVPKINVVTIDDRDYESAFMRQSPLDRGQLLLKIKQLFPGLADLETLPEDEAHSAMTDYARIRQLPRSLAIDLDISPSLNPIQHDAELRLYQWLANFSQVSQVVLIIPMPVSTENALLSKMRWVSDMYSKGIDFVVPALPSVDGIVMKYHRFCLSMSQVLAPNDYCAQKLGVTTTSRSALPELLPFLHTRSYPKTMDQMTGEAADDPDTRDGWLNFRYTQHTGFFNINDFTVPAVASSVAPSGYLFIGGSYGLRDRYDTPVKEKSGVDLHAASLFSQLYPVKDHIWLAYLLEVVLGSLSGIVFYAFAQRYRQSESLTMTAANILVHPLIIGGLIWLSAILIARFDVHVNAGPISIAMALHAEIVRLQEPRIVRQNPPSVREKIERYITKAGFWVVFLSALFVMANYTGIIP